MSDNDENDDKMSEEDLIDLLSHPELLRVYGYQLTPKGCIALILMQAGHSSDEAGELATKMDNLIFLQGWIYVQENEIEVVPDSPEGL